MGMLTKSQEYSSGLCEHAHNRFYYTGKVNCTRQHELETNWVLVVTVRAYTLGVTLFIVGAIIASVYA